MLGIKDGRNEELISIVQIKCRFITTRIAEHRSKQALMYLEIAPVRRKIFAYSIRVISRHFDRSATTRNEELFSLEFEIPVAFIEFPHRPE